MRWSSAGFFFIDILWCFLACSFFIALCVHNIWRKHKSCRVYMLFQDLIRYGKTKQNGKRDEWLRVLDVPKRWFWHFYLVSVCWNGFLLVSYLKVILQHRSHPSWLLWTVNILTGPLGRADHVPQLSTVLLYLLLWIHSLRRLLECLCVSVFSDGYMNLVQYLFGLGYYIVLGLTVLCSDHVGKETGSLHSQVTWFHVVGVGLFVAASVLQHRSMVLLAGLRIGKSGAVETLAHRIPTGGWFEWVSCPHYFAELLIYISLAFMSESLSITWWLVVLYVLFNQALAAQLCHELYISKYDSYPTNRKAFIPFVF
ncbi:polyprenal reductase [Cynoglossus semilaevis]|uniref:Polyprenal reductase n=1 Tax=Cynoglossus semilaevis TaxID=244447 RepID=A0A3P8UZ94_CYNSE|nr:polyprenol reductase [Cynoglossus semilaevis]